MSITLAPYSEYKNSDLQEIGKIPIHWQQNPLRSITQLKSNRGRLDLPLLSVYRDYGVILKASRDDNHNKDGADLSIYKVVAAGDLVLNKMKMWQGSLGVSDHDGIVSPAYIVCNLIGPVYGRFLHHLLRSRPYIDHYNRLSFGVRISQWDMRYDDFKQIPVYIPPLDEQKKIAGFVDAQHYRINSLISDKRRLIELLNEQKQVIIHRAVTRGLDSNVPLKPSGIDWLGNVPEYWEIGALRRFWKVIDCKHFTVPFIEDGFPLASVGEVQSFNLDLTHCKRTTEKWSQYLVSGGRKPKRGDLIYCRNTSVGACACVNTDIDFSMGQDVCLITSDIQNQRYLNYLLHSWFMSEQLEQLMVGPTFKRINISNIRSFVVLVPPRQEQDAICRELDEEVMKLTNLKTNAENEIYFLREYHTRLIADVVTGKLDVRGVELPVMNETITLEDIDIGEDAEELIEIEEVADADE
jgi:type I restriction enzyme S subunit